MPLERQIRSSSAASPATTTNANKENHVFTHTVTKPMESIINRDYSSSSSICSSTLSASHALTMTITSMNQDREPPQRIQLSPDRIAAILGRALTLVELSEDVDDDDNDDFEDDDDFDSEHELSPFGTRRDSIDDFRARSLTSQSD